MDTPARTAESDQLCPPRCDVLLIGASSFDGATIKCWLSHLCVEEREMIPDLKTIARLRPAWILLDLDLPGYPGGDALETVLRLAPAALVVTGSTDDSADGSLRCGAEDFLVKGAFDRPALLRSLRFAQERFRSKRTLQQLNEHLHTMVQTDHLTGVRSRQGLSDALSTEQARCRRLGGRLGVMLIDLDDFKWINDRFGYDTGDAALRAAADVLSASLREVDCVGRIGGDEFLVLLSDARYGETQHVAERIRHAVAEIRLETETGTVALSCSVGTGMTSLDDELETILRRVHPALRRSKILGKNRITAVDDESDVLHRCETTLGAVSQSIRRLDDQSVHGHEFFIRGVVGDRRLPEALFQLSMYPQRLQQLDLLCLQTVLEAAQTMPPGHQGYLNLFPSTLLQCDPDAIRGRIGASGKSWTVEITEQMFVGNLHELAARIAPLREICRIAIDDVGGGRSSLEALIVLRPDEIKLDRSVFSNANGDRSRSAALARICSIAQTLDCTVTAVGVETESELALLCEQGVSYGQGFLFDRPG